MKKDSSTAPRLAFVNGNDYIKMAARRPSTWGDWQYDGQSFQLVYSPNGYAVDLDRCTNSAQLMDYIAQVAGKNWAVGSCLAGLVRGLDDILGFQGSVCTGGVDHTIAPRKVAAARGYK